MPEKDVLTVVAPRFTNQTALRTEWWRFYFPFREPDPLHEPDFAERIKFVNKRGTTVWGQEKSWSRSFLAVSLCCMLVCCPFNNESFIVFWRNLQYLWIRSTVIFHKPLCRWLHRVDTRRLVPRRGWDDLHDAAVVHVVHDWVPAYPGKNPPRDRLSHREGQAACMGRQTKVSRIWVVNGTEFCMFFLAYQNHAVMHELYCMGKIFKIGSLAESFVSIGGSEVITLNKRYRLPHSTLFFNIPIRKVKVQF